MSFSSKISVLYLLAVLFSIKQSVCTSSSEADEPPNLCKAKDQDGFYLKLCATLLFKKWLILVDHNWFVYQALPSSMKNSYGQLQIDIYAKPIEEYWPAFKIHEPWPPMKPNVTSICHVGLKVPVSHMFLTGDVQDECYNIQTFDFEDLDWHLPPGFVYNGNFDYFDYKNVFTFLIGPFKFDNYPKDDPVPVHATISVTITVVKDYFKCVHLKLSSNTYPLDQNLLYPGKSSYWIWFVVAIVMTMLITAISLLVWYFMLSVKGKDSKSRKHSSGSTGRTRASSKNSISSNNVLKLILVTSLSMLVMSVQSRQFDDYSEEEKNAIESYLNLDGLSPYHISRLFRIFVDFCDFGPQVDLFQFLRNSELLPTNLDYATSRLMIHMALAAPRTLTVNRNQIVPIPRDLRSVFSSRSYPHEPWNPSQMQPDGTVQFGVILDSLVEEMHRRARCRPLRNLPYRFRQRDKIRAKFAMTIYSEFLRQLSPDQRSQLGFRAEPPSPRVIASNATYGNSSSTQSSSSGGPGLDETNLMEDNDDYFSHDKKQPNARLSLQHMIPGKANQANFGKGFSTNVVLCFLVCIVLLVLSVYFLPSKRSPLTNSPTHDPQVSNPLPTRCSITFKFD